MLPNVQTANCYLIKSIPKLIVSGYSKHQNPGAYIKTFLGHFQKRLTEKIVENNPVPP